jgi:catechol 2,3-dioxygenase-like lactoylglutathione lyase family enzyme
MTPVFPASIHHVALTVTDLDTSRDWYRRLIGTAPVLDEDVPAVSGHHKGFHHTIFVLPGGVILALHTHPDPQPGSDRFDEVRPGLDHIGFGCADRAELQRLQQHLDDLGINHGGIADDALGHGLSFRDPDNIALEFWAPRS